MRTLLGFCVALLCVSSAPAQTKYDTLVQEYDEAATAFRKRLQKLSGSEVSRVYRDENPQPKFALRFLDFARKNPKDPAAYVGLVWIAENSELIPAAADPYAEAMTLLAEKYADHKDNVKLFDRLAISPFSSAAPFLKAVFERHPNTVVRGRAGFTLAIHLKNYCFTAEQLHLQPAWAKNVESFIGPKLYKQIYAADRASLLRQAEDMLIRVQKDYGFVAYKRTVLGKAAEGELFELRHLMVGKVAPDIVGEDIDGTKIKLSDFRGKVVVLVFWGTWCPHCMAMLPQEREFMKRYEGKAFTMLGVNSDSTREKLKPVLTKERITWRNFWDGGSSDGPIATRWNVQGWPAVFVIDSKGVIRYKHVRDDMLEHGVETLMREMSK